MRVLERIGWGVLDQALSSLSNVVFMIALARVADTAVFGALSLAYAGTVFGLGVLRGSLGTLAATDSVGRLALKTPLKMAIAWAAATSAITLSLAMLVGLSPAYLALALGPLLVFPQDLLRYAAIARGRVRAAASADAIWLVLSVGILGWTLLPSSSGHDLAVVVVWLAGAGMALTVLAIALLRGQREDENSAAVDARELRTLIPLALLSTAVPLMLAAIIAAVLGSSDVAAVRGGSTLIGPVSLLLSAVPLVVLPLVAQARGTAGTNLARAQSVIMLAFVIAWGLMVLFLPDRTGTALLGPTWPLTHAIWLWVVLEYCTWALASGPQVRLQSERLWGVLFRLKVLYVLVASAFLAVTIPTGDLEHVMAGMLAAGLINLGAVAFALRRATRDGRVAAHAGDTG